MSQLISMNYKQKLLVKKE